VLKFYAFMLIFSGSLTDVKFRPEPFDTLAQCQEEISEVATRTATLPVPEGVTKIKFVCLPVQDEIHVSD